jgi:hypothetical protein
VADRDQLAERLVGAVDGLAAAKVERDQAVTDALKADLSVRAVAAITGLSTRTVQDIGHANGWPTAAQRKRWDAKKQASDDFIAKYAPPGYKRSPDSH